MRTPDYSEDDWKREQVEMERGEEMLRKEERKEVETLAPSSVLRVGSYPEPFLLTGVSLEVDGGLGIVLAGAAMQGIKVVLHGEGGVVEIPIRLMMIPVKVV